MKKFLNLLSFNEVYIYPPKTGLREKRRCNEIQINTITLPNPFFPAILSKHEDLIIDIMDQHD